MKQLRLLLAVLVASAASAFAQVPANDNFANRIVLSGNLVTVNSTVVNATKEADENFHAFNSGGHSVWYEWTPTFTAAVSISGFGSGNFRILLAAYTGTSVSSNSLTEIDSAIEPQFGGNAVLSFTATVGTVYKIAVDGRNGTTGTFSFTLNQPVPVPTVSMTAPVPGQSFTNPAMITLSAAASSGGGPITNVSFYYGGNTLIGIDTNSPYSIVWSNVAEGTYSLTTRATDTNGQTGVSSARTINVRPPGYFSVPLIHTNSIWKYLDNGSDQGTAWRAWGFDDSTWASGPGQLGYSSNPAELDEATVVSFGGNTENKFVTTYFRHAFTVTNVAGITNLFTRVLRDDGVAVYLNGIEVQRNGLADAAGFLDFAVNAGDDGYTPYFTNIPPTLLSNGVNVIAAEIHQSTASSTDISFYLELFGEGAGSSPAVAITNPTNNASLFAPASVTIMATASDADGTVTNVEFFVDGVKIGQTNNTPYDFVWNSPAIGPHVITVTARDNAGASGSAQSAVVVYDAVGTPFVQITSPTNNPSFAAPANISVSASANAANGVTNVEFYFDTTKVGEDASAPYNFTSNSVFAGSYAVRAVAVNATGLRGTSSVVNVTVTNTPPPTVLGQTPAPGNVASLSSVQVTFSKVVVGVNAADFLVEGVAATGVTVSGGGTIFTFTFPQPAFGTVNITWAAGHGIADLVGQPFNASGPGATWSYNFSDPIPPTISSRSPVAGATVTNLTSIQVVFSENVLNVDAGDLLVNGNPATGLTGSGANYTFSFGQPGFGAVSITWAGAHGITDASGNPFNGAGATWSYTLTGPQVLLVATNASFTYFKGQTSEPSNPVRLWRTNGFNDSTWLTGPAPFGYDDNTAGVNYLPVGTLLSDMRNSYFSVFMRHQFQVPAAGALTNVVLRHRIDDGAIIWLNGIEIFRSTTMGTVGTEIPFNTASGNITDQAGYTTVNLAASVATLFRTGTNLIAIQAQNSALDSTDLIASGELTATLLDPLALPPSVSSLNPVAGPVFALTSITVTFSEAVQGIDPADLLINGTPATGVSGASNAWIWTFPQPAYGNVNITWAGGANITDFDAPPKAFIGSSFSYTLFNPSAPTVTVQAPVASATVSALTSIAVTFNENVTGVNASDLLVNGTAATGLSGSGANYTFTFTQPAYGPVTITWAAGHGITDTEPALNAFNPAQSGNTWAYTLVDQTPPTIASQNPPAGANVTNLTSLSVTFSEAVQNVNASDLRINGLAATQVTGGPATYTFTFAQPNTSIVNVNWAIGHGITDTAPVANPFDGNGVGATWQYFTPDNVPPVVATINPPPSATVRDLNQVVVTFAEPVTGVDASDLLINGTPATQVAGSSAGPYTFQFTQPATGAVEIVWAGASGITDLASPPNAFAGGEWSYILNPNAVFADKIVINEIMYLPPSKKTNDEWIELKNTDTTPVNLNGWKFSKGVSYTFPNINIPAGGYLVVAADPTAFALKYPGVTNVVGPWDGSLGNNGEKIQLETALGENVNEVEFATEGDWAVRQRSLVISSFRGWVWSQPADGFGPSLELINSAMPNKHGQNWQASTATNGTPGVANAVARTNIPPLLLDVAHTPAVPRSTDPVVISTRILDERTNGLVVTVFYRPVTNTAPPAFSSLTMFDDGAHNDGVSNDKVWAATLPLLNDKTVIEFYVQAVDADNNTNYWPRVAYAAPDQGGALLTPQTSANALFQVDDTVYTFAQPQYRLIMTEQERRDRFVSTGNAEFNGTFISTDGTGTEVRYNASFRERGAGSRGTEPANQRVNIPTDHRWKGQREFNLNTRYVHSQYAGYLLSRKAGLDTEFARVVRVYINGTNNSPPTGGFQSWACYIHVEAPNGDLVTAHFPEDDGGNLYRAGGSRQAYLNYLGTNPVSYVNAGYDKASNIAENDWTDLMNLTFALGAATTPNSNYTAAVRAIVNVEAWMIYFAMDSILYNQETLIANGDGDDYGLYFAPKEKRFYFVAHDWDTILNQGDTAGTVNGPIFRADGGLTPNVTRFMHWPEFEPIYYATLRRLCTTTLSPAEVARILDEGLGGFVPTATIDSMKQFHTNRVAYILSILPADTNAPTVAGPVLSGTIAANTLLTATNSPYTVTSTLTIASGATVTVQPGVTLQIASGANITVANGGRLIAEGTAASPILFTRSGGANWGQIIINGAVGSPESRIAYARIEFNGGNPAINVNAGTVVLDHLTFGNTALSYIHVDGASFVISHCEFPGGTAAVEPVHGNGAVKAGGRGIFYRNWFGKTIGYSDTIDYTGGNRPGSPIVQFIDNVFTGSDDDILDLDGTDAWVEGNIFLHTHRNGSPDSASAVSGGSDSGNTSEITVIGNIFYDVDQAATAKQLNFYTFINNTVVHQSGAGFGDAGVTAVLNFADEGIAQARGMYVEGNIIHDAERLTRNVTNGTTVANNTTFNGNVMPFSWAGPGASNDTTAPVFNHIPTLAETTNFTNWASAQVLRDWFSLAQGSPGHATGPNGSDKGGAIPIGASVSVQPGATTNDAILVVGVNRSGGAITASGGFPNGSGYTHYKWRIDGGSWSAETPIATPINLPGFKSGSHRVDVSGRRDSGTYQDDPDLGELAVVTSVFSSGGAQALRINEVLASNQASEPHEGTFPDIIELYNPGSTGVDIGGMRLTDDLADPDKFTFPAGVVVPAGGYLAVYANNDDGTSGIHLGFSLNKDGQSLALYDAIDRGGVLIDSITFGLQVTDYSIGRVGTNWVLCRPTAGRPNVSAPTGAASRLIINEILAAEISAFPDDFVEIYNPQAAPVAMGGLFFTDNPPHWPNRSPVPALSFIAGGAYIAFHADGEVENGADHLSFALEAERGLVALLNTDYSVIDCYIYGPQTTDVSQGRVANNIYDNNFFTTPTPGAANPGLVFTNTGVVISEVLANNSTIAELDGSKPDWVEFFNNAGTNVNMSGYSFTDDSLLPRKYVFGPGTVIAGQGRLRIRCDGDIPAGSTNTGFNIKAEGGTLFLFNQSSNLVNALTYGLQATDYSISRVPEGTGPWVLTLPTPGGAPITVGLGSANSVKINEWMANPSSGEDWFELWNPNAPPVAIGGFYLTDLLTDKTKSPIPALSFLGGSTNGYQRFWADSAPAQGANHANFRLNNGAAGEAIGFFSPSQVQVDAINYTQPALNVSEGRFPDGAPGSPGLWTRFPETPSPGDANYLRLTNIVINEALTHTDLPFEDAIEIRNLYGTNFNVGGWFLSDAKGSLKKFRIPTNTVIAAGGYVVFYESAFNFDPTNNLNAFSLSSDKGDQIYLSAADVNGNLTGFRGTVDFGAAQNAVSFGRYVTSDNREEFVAMSARSFGMDDPGNVVEFRTGTGANNPYPKVGPIVISQIMYHPPDNGPGGTNDNTLDEYIELKNITGGTVPLFDTTNTWRLRDAVDYDFPQGVSLVAGENLVLVTFDPVNSAGQTAIFRTKYGIGTNVQIYGPYLGKLANNDDKVEVYMPDTPNVGSVPYVLVDRVHYYDLSPWQSAADGSGFSLNRRSLTGFGNDPTNWFAAAPNFGGAADSDTDGMPDFWENQYGLNRNNPADANLDNDGDGATNLQEYLAGTNPLFAGSVLRIISIESLGNNNARLTFLAMSNRTYTIEYKDGMVDPVWLQLTNIGSAPTNRLEKIDTTVTTNRFFRLRTPQVSAQASLQLRIDSIGTLGGTNILLTFVAASNTNYTVQYKNELPDAAWLDLSSVSSAPTNRTVTVSTLMTAGKRFFRLRAS
jgi:hypothetical protein